MAKEKVQIEYSLKDKASKGLGRLSGKMIGVVAGIGALAAGVKKSVDLFGVQEAAVQSLNTALENNTDFTEENSQALQDQASSLQKVTTFGDEQIISAQAQLAQMGLSTNEIMSATEATLDFATAQGMDLDSAAKLVGKSIGTSTNALTRYGIEIDASASKGEKLDSVIAGLNEKFGGQARGQAQTFAGSMKQMQNAMGDVGETVGAVLAPMLQKGAEWVTEMAYKFNEFAQTDTFASFIVKIQSLLKGLGDVFGFVWEKATQLFDFFTTSTDEKIAQVDEKIAELEEKKEALAEGDEEMSEREAEKFEELMERLAEQEDVKRELLSEKAQEQAKVEQVQEGQKLSRKATIDAKMVKMDRARIEAQKKLDAERAANFDKTLGFLAKGMQSKNKEIFEIGKASAIAQATMNTYQAFTTALASMPPPVSFIMGAATLAIGLDQVSKISSQQLQLQEGAIIEPSDGGTNVNVGEAGGAEAVIPLDEGMGGIGGGGTTIVEIDGREMAKEFYTINTDQIRNGEIQER